MNRTVAMFLLVSALGSAHAAAGIYRCGPDARTYSQTPCPDGRMVDAADPRSAAQLAEAKRVTALERKRAIEMERERLAQEATQRPIQATIFNARPPPATSAPTAKHRNKGKTKRKRVAAASHSAALVPVTAQRRAAP